MIRVRLKGAREPAMAFIRALKHGVSHVLHHAVQADRRVRRGRSPWARRGLALAFIAGSLLWFLPVLGIWMLPVGLALLSDDVGWMRRLRRRGVTIILTTHYIEEAEMMADRVGVIHEGEILLVEDKATLMQKLGRRELTLHLREPLEAIPEDLAQPALSLGEDGRALTFVFDAQSEDTGIAELLRRLAQKGVEVRDLATSESSLEEIFVSLVKGRQS